MALRRTRTSGHTENHAQNSRPYRVALVLHEKARFQLVTGHEGGYSRTRGYFHNNISLNRAHLYFQFIIPPIVSCSLLRFLLSSSGFVVTSPSVCPLESSFRRPQTACHVISSTCPVATQAPKPICSRQVFCHGFPGGKKMYLRLHCINQDGTVICILLSGLQTEPRDAHSASST